MSEKVDITLSKSVNALRSLSTPVQSTFGSVTAGVGDVLSGKGIASEITFDHKIDDLTSDEAHEAYKDYNTKVNKEINKIGFYSRFFESLSGALFIGAFAGIGVGLQSYFATTVGYGAIGSIAATAGILVPVAITVGLVGLMAKQHITQTSTGKGMDVADYQIKREAALIAKEIKAALDEDRSASANTDMKREDGKQWTEALSDQPAASQERIH